MLACRSGVNLNIVTAITKHSSPTKLANGKLSSAIAAATKCPLVGTLPNQIAEPNTRKPRRMSVSGPMTNGW